MQSKKELTTKKKILFVITKSNFGGAQKYVYELATSIPSSLFDVTVALGGNGVLKTKLENKGITTLSIPYLERDISLSKEARVFSFLYKLYKKEKYDVVHLNSSKIGGIGSVAARLAGIKKVIFTAHGWAFNEDRSYVSKLIIKASYYVTMLCCTNVIAVSKNISELVTNWPCIRNKISCIHNGVTAVDFYEKRKAMELLNVSIPKETLLLGTLAELHPIKGLDVLLASMTTLLQSHTNIHLLIFGEGSERTKLEKIIAENSLEKHVTLLGYVDNAPKYLQVLDIFVLPSRSEALSLAILEAGLAKLPVVASNVGGVPEIIIDKENGLLVTKENTEALTEALNTLITDGDQRMIFGRNLHETVTSKFSHTTMTQETIKLY